MLDLGNGRNGVHVADGDDNQIGGTSAGAANAIAYNDDNGVAVTSGDGGKCRVQPATTVAASASSFVSTRTLTRRLSLS